MNRKRTDVERALAHGLTVAELIEALQDMPEDAIVVFGSDYGDICHTEQALVVSRSKNSTRRPNAWMSRPIAIRGSPSKSATTTIATRTNCRAEETNRVVILRS